MKAQGSEVRRGEELTEPPEPEGGLPFSFQAAGAAETPKTVIAAMMTLVNCMLIIKRLFVWFIDEIGAWVAEDGAVI